MMLRGRVILCGLAAHYNTIGPAMFHHFDVLLVKRVGIKPPAISDHVASRGQAGRE